MDPSSRSKADEGAFDTNIDYDDDLKSEPESNRYADIPTSFTRSGSDDRKRNEEDFGRFEISDGEGDEE